jgi:hypothetical protein
VIASRHLALEHLLAASGCAAAGSACRRVPIGAEEGAQFFGVELGFLEWREMPAARGLGHAHDVRRAFEPGRRRDTELADRIRFLIGTGLGITEKKMFGGLAFLVGGNMAISASGQGGVLVRVDQPEPSPGGKLQ